MRALLIVSLILAGCGSSTNEKKPPAAPFALDAPKSLELLNGESRKLDVAVNWEQGDREDLDISTTIEPEGRGVSAKAEPARLNKGVGPAQIVVTASETASTGDYTLTITAKAVKSGKKVKHPIAVKVPRKE